MADSIIGASLVKITIDAVLLVCTIDNTVSQYSTGSYTYTVLYCMVISYCSSF